MSRRAPLPTAAAWAGLGRRPPNAIRFEPGQRIGLLIYLRPAPGWNGNGSHVLACQLGHEGVYTTASIQRYRQGKRGALTCRECRQQGGSNAPPT